MHLFFPPPLQVWVLVFKAQPVLGGGCCGDSQFQVCSGVPQTIGCGNPSVSRASSQKGRYEGGGAVCEPELFEHRPAVSGSLFGDAGARSIGRHKVRHGSTEPSRVRPSPNAQATGRRRRIAGVLKGEGERNTQLRIEKRQQSARSVLMFQGDWANLLIC